jgi:hypothetical protein
VKFTKVFGSRQIRILIRLLSHKKSEILHAKIYLKKVKDQKHTYGGTKAFSKGRKPGLFENLANFHAPGSGSAFPTRIRINSSQMNADPGGSGSGTLEQSVYFVPVIR